MPWYAFVWVGPSGQSADPQRLLQGFDPDVDLSSPVDRKALKKQVLRKHFSQRDSNVQLVKVL